MAIIYDATLVPGKLDLIGSWLDRQPWGGTGAVEQVGSYRLDDPAGEVGLEAMIVRRGELLLHVPVTYRSAPLDGGQPHLLGTMDHSVLGQRWVHDASADPVALDCFARALRGEQQQAVLEIWAGEALVEVRQPDVRLRVEAGEPGGDRLRIARVLDGRLDGAHRLAASWSGGDAVVAAFG